MIAQNDVRVTIRVDRELKESAERLFSRMGMNMSTALNVFLRKAVDEEAIPFVISAKSSVIGNGFTSAEITSAFTAAVRDDIAESKRGGHPIALYDSKSKRSCLEYADGTREYVDG